MSSLGALYLLVMFPFHLIPHAVSPELQDVLRLVLAALLFLLADVLVTVLICRPPATEGWTPRLGSLVPLVLVGAAAVTWPPAVAPVWSLYLLLAVTVPAHLLCIFGLPALLRHYAPTS